jgi:hypothetical protein
MPLNHSSPVPSPQPAPAGRTPFKQFKDEDVRDWVGKALDHAWGAPGTQPKLVTVYSRKQSLHAGTEPTEPRITREVEVLVRLRNEEGETVGALPTIAAAKKLGRIPSLDYAVLRQSCDELMQRARENAQPSPTRLSWNISAETLQQTDFSKRISVILDNSGFPPDRFTIELLEDRGTLAAVQTDAVWRQLQELRNRGVQVHIDDFPEEHSAPIAEKLLTHDWTRTQGTPVISGLKVARELTDKLRAGDRHAREKFDDVLDMMGNVRAKPVILTFEGAMLGEGHAEGEIRAAILQLFTPDGMKRPWQHALNERVFKVVLQGGLPIPVERLS